MERYRAYLLPGVAAVLVVSYYAWRWAAGADATEPAKTPAAAKEPSDAKAAGGASAGGPAAPAKPAKE